MIGDKGVFGQCRETSHSGGLLGMGRLSILGQRDLF